jgi:hypothetical protein
LKKVAAEGRGKVSRRIQLDADAIAPGRAMNILIHVIQGQEKRDWTIKKPEEPAVEVETSAIPSHAVGWLVEEAIKSVHRGPWCVELR